jgi:hypothetical protein
MPWGECECHPAARDASGRGRKAHEVLSVRLEEELGLPAAKGREMTRSRRTIAIAAGLIGAVVISAYPIDSQQTLL